MQIICEYKVLKLRVQEVANNIGDRKTYARINILRKLKYTVNRKIRLK